MADDLDALYAKIESRCRAISREHPDWPCAEGCDRCCRTLAEPPRATEAEWARLKAACARLDASVRATIHDRLRELARLSAQPEPPATYLCPMLDRERGACSVYEGRLAACRTYGFYASREKGAWCDRVRRLAEEREVLLGNEDAIDAERAALGPERTMPEVFGMEPPPPPPPLPEG